MNGDVMRGDTGRRYTAGVTWQQRAIGAATLVVLMMVPATATMCAIVCHDDHRADATAHCHEAAESSSVFQLSAVSAHDCGNHDAVVGDIASQPQFRISAVASPVSFEQVLHAERDLSRVRALTFAATAPPGSDPPTTTPTVLRV